MLIALITGQAKFADLVRSAVCNVNAILKAIVEGF